MAIGLTLVIPVEVACRRQPVQEAEGSKPELIGTWEKINPAECSNIYPDVIEFSANGIYQTQSEATAVLQVWDSGTFEVDRLIVKISNAKDITKAYRFVISKEIVTFEDDQGCVFPYRRM
ncbi:hypothetical protein GCM10028804_60890 [Larkinella terrae]